jgi:dolichol kinase
MSDRAGKRNESNFRRVAALLRLVAYALAVGGLFAWFILDKPFVGVVMLLVAASDGFASMFISRRAGKQALYIPEGRKQ